MPYLETQESNLFYERNFLPLEANQQSNTVARGFSTMFSRCFLWNQCNHLVLQLSYGSVQVYLSGGQLPYVRKRQGDLWVTRADVKVRYTGNPTRKRAKPSLP